MKKKFFGAVLPVLAALLAAALCLCGCSADNGGAESPGSGSGGSSIVADGVDRKIVYTVNMDIEADDVSAVRASLLEDSDAAGGYVEQQNEAWKNL